MSNQQPIIYSGDQNGVGWDAVLKLRILGNLGLHVKHAVHTADQFSRPPEDTPHFIEVTREFCRLDGNVNRWTASLEAPFFLGQTPLHPSELSNRGINFTRIARFNNCSVDNAVQQLTMSDWLGLSLKSNSRVAHGIVVKEFLSHFPRLRKPLRHNLLESVKPQDQPRATVCFDRLFSFTEYPQKTWSEATKKILTKSLSAAGCNGNIQVTTSVDTFACSSPDTVASPFLQLFLTHYDNAIDAYNEAVNGPGETIKPLECGDLPFYAVVRTDDNLLVRKDLSYQANDTIRSVLSRASKHGKVIAVLGKAITHVIELLMLAPIVICQEGSAYIPKAAQFAELFTQRTGVHLRFHQFHRLQLNALDALSGVTSEFKLPAYLQEAFGTDWISGTDFAGKWQEVVEKAESDTKRLSDRNQATLLPTLQEFGLLSDQTLSLLSSVQATKHKCDSQIGNLFREIKGGNLTDKDKTIAINNAKKRKRDLYRTNNLDLLAHTEQALLDGIEHEKATALQLRLTIIQSLRYWNNRPFTYWVDALPNWFETIQRNARLIPDTFFQH